MEELKFSIYTEEAEVTASNTGQTVDWGTHIVQAPALWHATKGEGIKIAVLDTGADLSHPDLAPNIKAYANFTTSNTQDAHDRQGHGTHCAGIISAIDNNIGVIGIAPSAELYIAKVLGDNGSGTITSIIRGIDWAIANKVDIISMSLGASQNPGPDFHNAVKKARQHGIVVIAASGNESTRCGWPAAYDECIAVGAVDKALDKADFSNFSPEVDIAAPGVSILSTYPGGRYARLSGTSMATPIVAGVIALIQSFSRRTGVKATPEMMINLISQRSVDLGADGKDTHFGSGLVNVFKLVKNYNKAPK